MELKPSVCAYQLLIQGMVREANGGIPGTGSDINEPGYENIQIYWRCYDSDSCLGTFWDRDRGS
jgi:hypothetical protein